MSPSFFAHLSPQQLSDLCGGSLRQPGVAKQVGEAIQEAHAVTRGDTWVITSRPSDEAFDTALSAFPAGVVVPSALRLPGPVPDGCFVVAVDNMDRALARLVRQLLEVRRAQGSFAVMTVTGCNGKTLTWSMLAAILSSSMTLCAPQRAVHNLRDLALAALRLGPEHDGLALELPMRTPDMLADGLTMLQPEVRFLTSLAPVYLDTFGSTAEIPHGFRALFDVSNAKQVILESRILHHFDTTAHDDLVVSTIGDHPEADLRVWRTSPLPGAIMATLRSQALGEAMIRLPVLGRYNAFNFALVAVAMSAYGLTGVQFARGLEQLAPFTGLAWYVCTAFRVRLMHDRQDANPRSMQAALTLMADMAPASAQVLILGEMAHLAEEAVVHHQRLGAMVAALEPAFVAFIGEGLAREMARGASRAGLANDRMLVSSPDRLEAVGRVLTRHLRDPRVALLKGGHHLHLEALLPHLGAQPA